MALSVPDCARLTGQTLATMEYFRPLRNLWNRAREFARASTTAAGITWMSRYVYQYHRLMLANLAPRAAATRRWPCYQLPPPHFLVGYQYLVRVCNDYVFDTRAYSRLKYREQVHAGSQTVNWSLMANCSYTINTGAYHRFVDLDDFQGTLGAIQQSILAERVVADLALIRPLRGYGRTHMEGERNEDVPVERLLQDFYKDLGVCQDQAWGMADRLRIQQAGRKDLVILAAIRRLKSAFFNYLLSLEQDRATATMGGEHLLPPSGGAPQNTQHLSTVLSLPCDCDWLDAFLQRFSDPVDLQLLRAHAGLTTQTLIRCIVNALSLPNPDRRDDRRDLGGGARPGLRRRPTAGRRTRYAGTFVLRPREDGVPVTETMRRRRGEMIERFIDRLPIRRRRRRAPPVPPVPPVAEEEEEEILPPPEMVEEEEEEIMEEEEEEPEPEAFIREVRATVAELIRLLEEELTVSARNSQFFAFAVDFYEAMQRLEALGDINELTLRRWVMYFFVTEHAATTLNYLYQRLRNTPVCARHVELNLAQVVMRARDVHGDVVYSRVWNENGLNAFQQLIGRISNDLSATVERAGRGELDDEEVEQFMAEIAYQDNSGDVSEILRQAAVNDAEIDSVELSFRFKTTGPVVFTQRPQIQRMNRRVVDYATSLRMRHLPLPPPNADVELPPPE
ncbi:pTP [Squirrel monkey adenovirus]|nr:pTP [Squirrel monkey adenovirus]